MFIVDDRFDEALASLMEETKAKARCECSIDVTSDPVELNGHIVKCRTRFINVRGRMTYASHFYINDKRAGYNYVHGKLTGRLK